MHRHGDGCMHVCVADYMHLLSTITIIAGDQDSLPVLMLVTDCINLI